jgi:ATP phosphoribosyltransferase regulatory subunit HisZ
MGYHLREIETKGFYGDPSKIREELEELEESLDQDNRILALVELSDLYGALEGVAEKLGSNMEELRKMSDATKRAFRDGSRRSK